MRDTGSSCSNSGREFWRIGVWTGPLIGLLVLSVAPESAFQGPLFGHSLGGLSMLVAQGYLITPSMRARQKPDRPLIGEFELQIQCSSSAWTTD